MRIAIDAMGGDYAPRAVVEGAVLHAREKKDTFLILAGDESVLKAELNRLDAFGLPNISIEHCSQKIEMDEPPVLGIRRKKDSSIMKAVSMVKNGAADAVVSAGNTGAAVAATKIKWRSLRKIDRPAIAVVMPSPRGLFVALDAGATPDCDPVNLFQFAVMGSVYAEYILGIGQPRVGLLSIGSEETKGTGLTKDTFSLIEKNRQKINFAGNIEGNDLFADKVDVVVCDGFTGNIVLKVCESLSGAFQYIIKDALGRDIWAVLGALFIKRAFKKIAKKVHYSEYGGAPLLGINGTCIISHGRSSPQAVKNAVRVAENMIEKDLNKRIMEAVSDE